MAIDFNSWLTGIGGTPTYAESGELSSFRFGNDEDARTVRPADLYDPAGRWQMGYSIATATDPSGRPLYGSQLYDPYNNALNAPPDDRYRIGDGFNQWQSDPRLQSILQDVGGELSYSPEWGYTIPNAAQERWKKQYSPDAWYEQGLGPWGMALAAFGGAAASGIAAGAGTGVGAAEGAAGAVSPWYDNTLASLGGTATDVGGTTLAPTAGGNMGFLSDLTNYLGTAVPDGAGYSMTPLYGGTDLGTMISQELAGMSGTAAPSISTGVLSGNVAAPLGAALGGGGGGFGSTVADWLSRLGSDLKLDTPKGQLGLLGNLYSVLQGNKNAGAIRDAGLAGAAISDPFGQQRPFYQQQLMQLFSDPTKLQQYPGYKAGLQAVERRGAAQGWNGSGNMMTSLADYGQNFFKDTVNQLMALAGANIGPGNAGNNLLQSQQLGAQVDANALARLGLMLPRGI